MRVLGLMVVPFCSVSLQTPLMQHLDIVGKICSVSRQIYSPDNKAQVVAGLEAQKYSSGVEEILHSDLLLNCNNGPQSNRLGRSPTNPDDAGALDTGGIPTSYQYSGRFSTLVSPFLDIPTVGSTA